ncbi:LL-diaminopimelate aminotransferase [Thermodesulfobacterium geofontis OPF15]|jgi:LL-diaminopimelate aminotransferase|uniref:LL-diaminopimelate aminotransferase n=1 Tax=Thermodesulfobacterium geofontis (strain OPF15) TaxID=795359 RepID=F8C3M7_THEGP|nr:LL-diaminopimelate aminotransferase [Thermodesulfobacterium geofontis]AEH22476.1 LL-diaminopimelate aminotransferase [Thermodesulfobacterium geofontis OPF15]
MKISERLKKVPPYLFVELDRLKNEKKEQGVDVIDLGIGDPDIPTPSEIVEVAKKALEKKEYHRYPSNLGSLFFRKAVADYMKKRFGVIFDPEKEILALIGSKEGIAHFPIGFVNPGDVVLCPDPAYPVYYLGTIFADGIPYYMPLTWENEFLPDLGKIPQEILEKAKIIWLNYPNNPTGAVAKKDFFKEVIKFAKKYNIIVAHDAAYIEMYYEEPPISIFEIDGAKDVAIEFHSLSKTFCMTGWRIGFAVGNSFLVSTLAKVKSNIDSGVFTAIQEAGAYALNNLENIVPSLIKVFKKRRDLVSLELEKLGYQFIKPSATFYLWVKTPKGFSSQEFCKKVLQDVGVVITPGAGFGKAGEGYFRIALTVEEERLKEAIQRFSILQL